MLWVQTGELEVLLLLPKWQPCLPSIQMPVERNHRLNRSLLFTPISYPSDRRRPHVRAQTRCALRYRELMALDVNHDGVIQLGELPRESRDAVLEHFGFDSSDDDDDDDDGRGLGSHCQVRGSKVSDDEVLGGFGIEQHHLRPSLVAKAATRLSPHSLNAGSFNGQGAVHFQFPRHFPSGALNRTGEGK
jgi:hypothetical protein